LYSIFARKLTVNGVNGSLLRSDSIGGGSSSSSSSRPIAFRIGIVNPKYTSFPASATMRVLLEDMKQRIIATTKDDNVEDEVGAASKMAEDKYDDVGAIPTPMNSTPKLDNSTVVTTKIERTHT
jgi:hypothetical protein